MSQLRVAVVGVGALGRHHARILSELPDVELIAVADSHAERGREVATRCHTKWVPDHRQLLSEVDAVSIVVPTTVHLAVAADFLHRGIPVLVEKPLAHNLAAARELVELARRHNTILQVGHVERFNPAWQMALPAMDSPKYLRAERFAPFTFRSTDIGVVLDLMIHDIDLVLSLVRSPIRAVEAFGIAVLGPNEDVVQARFSFQNGCIADLAASRVNPTARRTFQTWSRNGCVTVDLHQRTVTRYAPTAALLQGTSPLAQAQLPGVDVEALKRAVFGEWIAVSQEAAPVQDALTCELLSFLDCVRTNARPLVDGETALEAIVAANRVLAQVAAHQWEGHPGGAIGPLVIGAPAPSHQKAA